MTTTDAPPLDAAGGMMDLAARIRAWARELGFQSLGICGTELSPHDERLREWLAQGLHGEMDYMARHGAKRWRPEELLPGTLRVISVRMDYCRPDGAAPLAVLADPERAYVSRYALGRDYHKLMRARLATARGPHPRRAPGQRAARVRRQRAGAGARRWRRRPASAGSARTRMLIDPQRGLVVLPRRDLHRHPAAGGRRRFSGMHCGSCTRLPRRLPDRAFVAPFVLDARRCISYLTIELQGAIPEDLRPLIGNRVFGCDDCQLVCPWNKFARPSCEADFAPRHGLDAATLVELFAWSAEQFAERAAGTPLYRLGHERWLRNLAVALGNGPATDAARSALRARSEHPSELVREHVAWALEQLARRVMDTVPNGAAP